MAICLLTAIFSLGQKSLALSGSAWRPGSIIDDGIFYKNSAMSALEVQGFLNGQVGQCDTWGTKASEYGGGTRAQYGTSKGFPPPYTCLKDYSQNGLSAAQIIKQAADTYNVSPRVLLVTLQKEQLLVTDDWPWATQYRSAMGYGCPDTAPCDSEFYGFYNQVMKAASQFRRYANFPSEYRYKPYQNNFIQYNPNAGCGGTNVYVENLATAGLYNYTPYQPNQSALSNLYGSGDSCGAYGNRNFWRFFNDWFGTTKYSFGAIPSSSSIYSRSGCNIPTFNSSRVGRLYNPDTQDFLYTTDANEACAAKGLGFIWDGLVMENATGQDSIPIYRLANNERHVFTSSTAVRDSLLNSGFRSEGIGFYAYSASGADRTPVYGLQASQTFFLTSAIKEAEIYQSSYGYYSFGTAFYTKNLSSSPTPVYRLVKNAVRLYTPSAIEKSSAINSYGFSDEGIVSQNDSYPNQSNSPVFRLRSPTGSYFYTNNRIERDLAVVNYGYHSEAAGFYALLWSDKPVFRAVYPQNALRFFTNSYPEYNAALNIYGYRGEGVGWYSY